MASPIVSIRPGTPLAGHITARGDAPGTIAKRDLERYYAQLAIAEREAHLSEPEWSLLCNILNGSVLDETLAHYLAAELEDAKSSYWQKWAVEREQLIARVRAMPEFTRLAIVDAVERWQREQG